MLRDKHGRKYAVLFSNSDILCKLIRACHLHRNSCSLVGERDSHPNNLLLPKADVGGVGGAVGARHMGGGVGDAALQGISDSVAVVKSLLHFRCLTTDCFFKPTSLSPPAPHLGTLMRSQGASYVGISGKFKALKPRLSCQPRSTTTINPHCSSGPSFQPVLAPGNPILLFPEVLICER